MTEGIWIALIGVVQAVSLGLLGKVTKDSSRSRKQVENSHGTNFRDDVDGIKTAVDDVAKSVDHVSSTMHRIEDDVKGTKKDIGRLDDRDLAHSRHHDHTDKELSKIRDTLDKHLEWSRDFVSDLEKEK